MRVTFWILVAVIVGAVLLEVAAIHAQPPAADRGDQPPAPSAPAAAAVQPSEVAAVVRTSAANEATIAVLKEQVDRLRDDVRNATMLLQTVQAKFETLSQTYVPRAEAEQARKLDAGPERVASLSARMDALEGRVNSYGDSLLKTALGGLVGVGAGAAGMHYLRRNGGPGPTIPPGYAYHRVDDATLAPGNHAEAIPDNMRPPPAVVP